MGNIFDWTDEDRLKFEKENLRCKEKFESLHLDFYTENPVEDWYTFISHLEHYNKSWGTFKLLYEYLTIEKLESWGKERRCYALGYVLYLCNKFNFDKPDYMDYYKDEKLDKILFGHYPLHELNAGRYDVILNTYLNPVNELSMYNIYCREIEVVVRGA